jgi:hypothetical protein
MSAFGGKADLAWTPSKCQLLTQNGHEQLKIAAVQTDPWTPLFANPQIPAVISEVGAVLRLAGRQCDDAIAKLADGTLKVVNQPVAVVR